MFTFSHGRALRMHSSFLENTQTDVLLRDSWRGFFMTHERTASLVCSHFVPPSLSQVQLMGIILHVRQGEPWCCALQGSWFVFSAIQM